MKYAADFRQEARAALQGKWPLAILVGLVAAILGGATSEGWYPFSWGVDQSNYRTFALDRWTENNPSQDVIIPRLHKNNANNANNRVASTWWLRNGSFLRLKIIEFGYQLPKKFMDKIGFVGCPYLYYGI